jgi:hypothetical protein
MLCEDGGGDLPKAHTYTTLVEHCMGSLGTRGARGTAMSQPLHALFHRNFMREKTQEYQQFVKYVSLQRKNFLRQARNDSGA